MIFILGITLTNIINLLLIGYSIFIYYITNGSPNSFRIIISFFAFIHIIIGLVTIYYANIVLDYKAMPIVSKFFNFWNIDVMIILVIVSILASICILGVNVGKSKKGYILFSSALLIIAIVLMSFGGILFK